MALQVANPFANLELKIPRKYHEDFQSFTMSGASGNGEKKDSDRSPFERYVDFWWAAIGVGYREGKVTELLDSQKFVTGVVFNNDPWRIIELQLLAIGYSGGTDILKSPGDVIGIANGFAATGIPLLCEELQRKLINIWDVSCFIKNKIEGGLSL